MIYEKLKIKLDLYDPVDILKSAGKEWCNDLWFVVCDDGDCHLFNSDGTEDDIKKINSIPTHLITFDVKKIIIPDSVTSIEHAAFADCRDLTHVIIPDSVIRIEHAAFDDCESLTRVMIPDSVTYIGKGAFYRCEALMNVTIGSGVTSIGGFVFSDCNKLKTLVFKGKTMDEVKVMDNYPFGIEDESIIKCC